MKTVYQDSLWREVAKTCKNHVSAYDNEKAWKSSVSGMQLTFSSIAKLDWISKGEFPMDGLCMKHPNQFNSAFEQWNSFFITPTPQLLYCHHWYWHLAALAQSFTILHQQPFTSTLFEHKHTKHRHKNITDTTPPQKHHHKTLRSSQDIYGHTKISADAFLDDLQSPECPSFGSALGGLNSLIDCSIDATT